MHRLDEKSEEVMRAVECAFDTMASNLQGALPRSSSQFHFRRIVAGLFGRSIRSFKAFAILARCGYTLEAELLTRNAFELLVEILLLVKDPVESVRRYLDYAPAAQHELVTHGDILEKQHGFLPVNVSDEDRQRLAEAHSDYLSKYSVKKLPKHWSGINQIEQRARDVDLLPVYERAYRRQSRIGHVHPQTNSAFWKRQSLETEVFKAYTDFEDVGWCVFCGCLIASVVLDTACKHLELPCEDVVNNVGQLVKRYSDAYLVRASDENPKKPFV